MVSFPGNCHHRRFSLVLYLLFLQTQALHCHRKHDHSSDVLLRSDASTFGSRHFVTNDVSNETVGAAAKLVQIDDDNESDDNDDVDGIDGRSSNVTKSFVTGVNVTRTGGGKVISFCPARCHCDISTNNQLQGLIL